MRVKFSNRYKELCFRYKILQCSQIQSVRHILSPIRQTPKGAWRCTRVENRVYRYGIMAKDQGFGGVSEGEEYRGVEEICKNTRTSVQRISRGRERGLGLTVEDERRKRILSSNNNSQTCQNALHRTCKLTTLNPVYVSV